MNHQRIIAWLWIGLGGTWWAFALFFFARPYTEAVYEQGPLRWWGEVAGQCLYAVFPLLSAYAGLALLNHRRWGRPMVWFIAAIWFCFSAFMLGPCCSALVLGRDRLELVSVILFGPPFTLPIYSFVVLWRTRAGQHLTTPLYSTPR